MRAWAGVASIAAAILIGASQPADSQVRFVDANSTDAAIAISGGTVRFFVSEIKNDSSFPTGTLRLELWATSDPFAAMTVGVIPRDFKLAQLTLGVLNGGQQFTNVKSPPLQLGTPPDGVWYYILFLTEFNAVPGNDGFTVADSVVELSGVTVGTPVAPPPPQPTAPAIEYFNADWGFYFITAFPEEIEAIDGGAFDGAWQRTGLSFDVWPQAAAGLAPACRFFSDGSFAPKSTHFYTSSAAECAAIKASPIWSYEGIAFYLQAMDANGLCQAGTLPLYRLYNNSAGGAPNHRYTTSADVLDAMLAAGWIFEGNGITKTFACVPQ